MEVYCSHGILRGSASCPECLDIEDALEYYEQDAELWDDNEWEFHDLEKEWEELDIDMDILDFEPDDE